MMKFNHLKYSVFFLLLPNFMAFLQLFIWKPLKQCLNMPGGNKCGNVKDFTLKVVLNQVYTPFLGMKCLLNPLDNEQKDIHWDHKLFFFNTVYTFHT